jgi:hypothetical protein
MQPTADGARRALSGLLFAVAFVVLGAAPARAEGGPTFEQVLAAPDDVELNYDYARSEADAGNLLNAAAAMERVLDASPQWDEARLYYAVLLFRLDDIQGARGQLRLLEDAHLNKRQRRQADEYRHLVGPWGWRP